MGFTSKGKNPMFSDLELTKLSDDSIVCGNVLFWNTGKCVILTSGPSCQMYSVTTGEKMKELFVCDSNIVMCSFHPNDSNKLIALGESGKVIKYDLNSETVSRTFKLIFISKVLNSQKVSKFNVNKKFYSAQDRNENYIWEDKVMNDVTQRKFVYGEVRSVKNFPEVLLWASWSLSDEYQSHVSVFMCSNGAQVKKARLPKGAYKKCYKNFLLSVTNDGNLLFLGMGANFVQVCQYKEGGIAVCSSQIHLLGDSVEVMCMAVHPQEMCFATGDSRGLIVVWRNIFEKYPLKSTHAWHTVDIRDLAFSNEGVHLFSGGDENVLVKWSFLSNQKNFLPRLSSPVVYISVAKDTSLVAISVADNEIYIIDTNFQKVSVIKKRSLYSFTNWERYHYVLTNDPRNDHLVLNGRPGYLQFVDCSEGFNVLYSLDVSKTNYMTGDRHLVNLDVTHAKFNRNGSLLVTAEARKDDFLKEYRLKFWQFDEVKQTFSLNTSIELPHDENDVHSLEVSSNDWVATSSLSDQQFKLWAPFEAVDEIATKSLWSLAGAGRYRLLPCGPVDFCKDATLIGVGFGPSLTLWNTSDCSLKCSLIPPFKRDTLRYVKFGGEEHSHLIAAATDFSITTWNIITLTMVWAVDIRVVHLVGDSFGSCMCAFSANNSLFVFSPGSTSPEFVMENVTDSPVVAAHSVMWYNHDGNPFRLFFMNSNKDLFCLKSKGSSRPGDRGGSSDVFQTRFAAQVAGKSGGGVARTVAEYIPTKLRKDSHYVSSILDAPAHALPNPRRFCADFLESLTVSAPKEVQEPVGRTNPGAEEDDDVVEIVKDDDGNKPASDVMSEEALWEAVNDLFK